MSYYEQHHPLVAQIMQQQIERWNEQFPSPSLAVAAEFLRSTPEDVKMALEMEMPDLIYVAHNHAGTLAGAIAEHRINSR